MLVEALHAVGRIAYRARGAPLDAVYLARAGHMVHQDRPATVRRHLLHLAREGG